MFFSDDTACQVIGVCLDPRCVPLTCIPRNQQDAAWKLVRVNLIDLINECRQVYNPSQDGCIDWLAMAELSAGSGCVGTAEEIEIDREDKGVKLSRASVCSAC